MSVEMTTRPGRLGWLAPLVLALCLQAGTAGAADKQKIAVLELNARGLDADVARSITDVVAREVDRSGLFETLSTDDIRAMLQHEQSKMLVGCDDASCLAEIGGALGVAKLLAGNVGKIGETYVISLKLIDVRAAEVVNREERTVRGKADDLIAEARAAVKVLLRPLMKKAEGALSLACSEEGAEVYVDDLMIGTTPLPTRKLPGGYHALKVKKASFVVFAKDVLIEPGKTSRLEAVLIPSPEFIVGYEQRASTYRSLAWTFTALAVASAGAAGGLLVWNDGRLGDYRQDRKRYEEEGIGDAAALNDRADSINLVDTLSWVMGGIGVASLGTALYLWIAGDPPGRYEHLRTKTQVEAAWDISPRPVPGGGLAASFSLRF